MGIPDHLTCLLRKQYGGQEATVRIRHGTIDWFKIGEGVRQDCILSPCLFNFYAEYLMQNAWLDEAKAGIKIAGRDSNNLRYADDITVMSVRKEKLNIFLMKVKEKSEKSGLKFNTQKTKSVICHFMPNRWGDNGNSERLYLHSLLNHCRSWLLPWN